VPAEVICGPLKMASSQRGVNDTFPLEELYEAEFQNIWRSLRRLGVPDAQLEDAVQEVFVAAHARRHHFDRSRPLRPWLFGIAVRVAAELRRKARRTLLTFEAVEGTVRTGRDRLSPEEAMAARETRDLIDEALAHVDFDQRVVIVMHDLEEVAAPVIAETMSIPLNTVYSRLRLARAKVLLFLKRRRGQP
jgi:RNA polymerase sigma-70 factor, ECF subfamily